MSWLQTIASFVSSQDGTGVEGKSLSAQQAVTPNSGRICKIGDKFYLRHAVQPLSDPEDGGTTGGICLVEVEFPTEDIESLMMDAQLDDDSDEQLDNAMVNAEYDQMDTNGNVTQAPVLDSVIDAEIGLIPTLAEFDMDTNIDVSEQLATAMKDD
jgi:hypothetical protein